MEIRKSNEKAKKDYGVDGLLEGSDEVVVVDYRAGARVGSQSV